MIRARQDCVPPVSAFGAADIAEEHEQDGQRGVMQYTGCTGNGPEPHACICRREKNWGFWEEDGKLLILYAVLPCTVVLEFDASRPSELQIRSRSCYVLEVPNVLNASGIFLPGKIPPSKFL